MLSHDTEAGLHSSESLLKTGAAFVGFNFVHNQKLETECDIQDLQFVITDTKLQVHCLEGINNGMLLEHLKKKTG